jgi:uncharacterized protein (TIGR02246 family)
MRSLTPFAAAALLVVIGPSGCSQTLSNETTAPAAAQMLGQDEAGVRTTLDRLEDAWNRHDIAGMQGLLTEDVQWIASNGNCWRNRQAVCDAYQILHAALVAAAEPDPLATLSIEHIEVRFLSPQIAIGMATLKFGGSLPGPRTRASFVMVMQDRAWRIAQFHQTALDPRVEREDPLWGSTDRRSATILRPTTRNRPGSGESPAALPLTAAASGEVRWPSPVAAAAPRR